MKQISKQTNKQIDRYHDQRGAIPSLKQRVLVATYDAPPRPEDSTFLINNTVAVRFSKVLWIKVFFMANANLKGDPSFLHVVVT